jgi:hypothetical protein
MVEFMKSLKHLVILSAIITVFAISNCANALTASGAADKTINLTSKTAYYITKYTLKSGWFIVKKTAKCAKVITESVFKGAKDAFSSAPKEVKPSAQRPSPAVYIDTLPPPPPLLE